jgi:hypothetical protein
MDTELEKLLIEVDAYLAATGMTQTAFGKASVNDVALMTRIRKGSPITTRTLSLARRFMADNPPKKDSGDNSEAA